MTYRESPEALVDASRTAKECPVVPWDSIILRAADAAALIGEDERGLEERVRLHGVRRRKYSDGEYRYYTLDLLGIYPEGALDADPRPLEASDGKDVYFVQPKEGGAIKIGSSGNVARRFTDLCGASPLPLQLLFVWEGASTSAEKRLHDILAAHRSHGEWFFDRPVVREYIEAIKKLASDPRTTALRTAEAES